MGAASYTGPLEDSMSVFDDMRALIDQMEQENGPMSEIVEAMKTQLETSNGLAGSNDLARNFAKTSNAMAKEN